MWCLHFYIQFILLYIYIYIFFLFSILPFFPFPPTAVRDDASVLLWSLQEVWFLIDRWRSSTVAALTCVCIAEPRPGNTRSILMTSPAPTLCSRLSLLAVETSRLSLREKRAGISKGTRASWEGEGLLTSEWRGSSFGRWRVADSASGLGLAYTQEEKRRGNTAVHC